MSATGAVRLIVNADDYGYFPEVSRGILAAAGAGKLTATGVIANAPDLQTQLAWLDQTPGLSIGVHLNLTSRRPLTSGLATKLAAWDGEFPGAYPISRLILTGKISLADVRREWCAQIESCGSKKLQFLNSHEHIHMLPMLFPLTVELAAAYSIPQVRLTSADWLWPQDWAGVIRNSLMQLMYLLNKPRLGIQSAGFLGLSQSGRLNLDYLAKVFSGLIPGQTYELMCHPGYLPDVQNVPAKLLAYHAWEAELALLQSPELQNLYEKFGIILSTYPE